MARLFQQGWYVCLLLLSLVSQAHAQEERMEAEATLSAKEGKPGDIITLKIDLNVKPGFHTYPTAQKDSNAASFVTTVRVKNEKDAPVERSGKIKEPEPKDKLEAALNATVSYFDIPVTLEVPLKIKANATGKAKFSISLVTQVCDDMGCVPFTKTFDFDISIKAAESTPPARTVSADTDDETAGLKDRMEASASLSTLEGKPGDTITLKLNLDVKPGFHTYPSVQKDSNSSNFVTSVRVKNEKDASVERSGNVKEPEPKDKLEVALGATVSYFDSPVTLEVPLKIKSNATAGKTKFTISLVTQVCDKMGCIPFTKPFDFEINIKPAEQNAAPSKKPIPPPEDPDTFDPNVKLKIAGPVGIRSKKTDTVERPQKTAETKPATADKNEETLWSFTLKGVIFGFITLLTPCVFPMIPITVSFFLKQNKTGQEAIINAAVYTLSIIISMSFIAYFFIQTFQELAQLGSTNLVIGALFIYFALSLFGAYEITLPSFLTRWTSAGESKGGYVGTIFMAMTFTIISFSCVAPFLGGFAGATAAERPVLWNIAGALGFAVAFASPFFLLALFPSWLKALPKSGGWLNTMKVVMGFLEVAAAIKFFRAAEMRWKAGLPEFLTFDVSISIYIALCFLCGIYLLGTYKLPHDDHGDEKKTIGVGRLIWSMVFISLGIYLFPAMFRSPDGEKLRPAGIIYSWIESFLLPGGDTKPIKLAFVSEKGTAASAQKWHGFLPEAMIDAKTRKQRIFIDFTGVT